MGEIIRFPAPARQAGDDQEVFLHPVRGDSMMPAARGPRWRCLDLPGRRQVHRARGLCLQRWPVLPGGQAAGAGAGQPAGTGPDLIRQSVVRAPRGPGL